MKKEIDKDFFTQYSPEKKSYEKIYQWYSRVDDAIILFRHGHAPKLKKICIFGTATGLVQNDFYEAFGLIPYGCEINEWAYKQIPSKFKKRTQLMDMKKYLNWCKKEKLVFDLAFSNSFQYLKKDEIPAFLCKLASICKYVHFHGSFKGDSARDPYRKTFESYAWWNEQFTKNKFQELKNTWEKPVYLWKSLKFK